ncbi:MAG: YMGG-like glycine zipper-containing protein, partial [Candidatus Zixiibacteriota bacterium]
MSIKSLTFACQLLVFILSGSLIMAENESPAVAAGSRIRIHYDTTMSQKMMPNKYYKLNKTQKLSGMLALITDDSITIADCLLKNGFHQHAIADLKKLEISCGRKGATLKGLLIGAGGGAMLGALSGFLDYDNFGTGDHGAHTPGFSPENTIIGAAGGALLGGIFGSMVKEDHWREVDCSQWPGKVKVEVNP